MPSERPECYPWVGTLTIPSAAGGVVTIELPDTFDLPPEGRVLQVHRSDLTPLVWLSGGRIWVLDSAGPQVIRLRRGRLAQLAGPNNTEITVLLREPCSCSGD